MSLALAFLTPSFAFPSAIARVYIETISFSYGSSRLSHSHGPWVEASLLECLLLR
jgi:hypothetical protein